MPMKMGVNSITYGVRYRIAAVPATKTHLTQRHFQASQQRLSGESRGSSEFDGY
jgi:hypothetical protein